MYIWTNKWESNSIDILDWITLEFIIELCFALYGLYL
jgi:hypothetical protein